MVDSVIGTLREFTKKAKPVSKFVKNIYTRGISLESRVPVVVYQMGKVGSKSIEKSLRNRGIHPLYHVHRINPYYIKNVMDVKKKRGLDIFDRKDIEGLLLYDEIIRRSKKSKFISTIREPVSRNISAFFERFVGVEGWNGPTNPDLIVESFLEEYNHEVPLTWFDKEPKNTLGIDVYEKSFPCEKGYVQLKKGPFELLVVRIDIADKKKEKIIKSFIGIDKFEIERKNMGNKKSYSNVYKRVKEKASLPSCYLEKMLQSKYTQHFYNEEEIKKIFDKWSKK